MFLAVNIIFTVLFSYMPVLNLCSSRKMRAQVTQNYGQFVMHHMHLTVISIRLNNAMNMEQCSYRLILPSLFFCQGIFSYDDDSRQDLQCQHFSRIMCYKICVVIVNRTLSRVKLFWQGRPFVNRILWKFVKLRRRNTRLWRAALYRETLYHINLNNINTI